MTDRAARPLALFLLLIAATAGAWVLLDPLAWPARAFATILLVPLPALLLAQAALAHHLPEGTDRETVYLSSALSVWAMAAMAMIAARFSDLQRVDLRLVPIPFGLLLAAAGLTVVAGIAVMVAGKFLRFRETPLVRFLMPRTGSEKIAFVGLSFSAGIAEELVFRSFLIAALTVGFGSLAVAVVASLVVFAVTHAYQGWTGTLRVFVLGGVLTAPFLITGSVYPSMIAHVALDILAGLVLADWLMDEPAN